MKKKSDKRIEFLYNVLKIIDDSLQRLDTKGFETTLYRTEGIAVLAGKYVIEQKFWTYFEKKTVF